jgi:hypothetical protein
MVLINIKPSRIGFEKRTFQGVNCDHVDRVIAEADLMEMDFFRVARAGLGSPSDGRLFPSVQTSGPSSHRLRRAGRLTEHY